MTIKGKVAIVTGANRGIGFEITKQLAKQGYATILTSRDESKGKKAVEQLKDAGLEVGYYVLDVSSEANVEQFKKSVEEVYGRCDVLVNNAGIFPETQNASGSFPSVFESDVSTIHEAMETNTYGPFMMMKAFAPLMKKNNYGRIVNLSSGMGQLSEMNGGCPGYRLSKTSLNALTRIFSEELKEDNVKVNAMCPGWVKTDMGGPHATRDIPEGAETAVWLSNLPDDGPSGKFFRDKKEFAW